MSTEATIYVKLLGEGTDAWRPVAATWLGDQVYRIEESAPYDREDEEWEFDPGTAVVCEERKGGKAPILIAIARA